MSPTQTTLTGLGRYECCICFRDSKKASKDIRMLWNVVVNEPATLNEWTPGTPGTPETLETLGTPGEIMPLDENTFFYGPCKKHVYCVKCLRNLALGFDNHLVGPEYSHIPCKPPFDGGCFTFTGMTNYFTHHDIRKILTADEFEQYSNHVDRFQFPGFEVVKCPRPIYKNGALTRCHAGILVSLHDIQLKGRGNVIMLCDQNVQCNRKSCYHCLNLISRHTDNCHYCITMDESKNPTSENRYFHVPGKQKKDGQKTCLRNDELTVDIVIQQLKEIVCEEHVYVRCVECLVPIMKTEQCNTLTHCKIERCYCCGRSGTQSERTLGDHWDTTGLKGCPRFDYSKYWNDFAKCQFQCQENQCYNDELGECREESHQPGIKAMHLERKYAMVYHAVRSLLPELREHVLRAMWMEKDLRDYIPKWTSTDHRTFHPDALYALKERTKLSPEISNLLVKVEFEKPKVVEKKQIMQPPTTSSSKKINNSRDRGYKDMFNDLYERYLA